MILRKIQKKCIVFKHIIKSYYAMRYYFTISYYFFKILAIMLQNTSHKTYFIIFNTLIFFSLEGNYFVLITYVVN